jgi:hypothetical protein
MVVMLLTCAVHQLKMPSVLGGAEGINYPPGGALACWGNFLFFSGTRHLAVSQVKILK